MALTLLEIDGVDRLTLLRTDSFEIVEQINGRNTARFTIYSSNGSYQPAFDDEVYIEIDGTNVFGGIVTERQIDYVAMGSATATTVTCSDFSHYAERRLLKASTPGGVSGRDAADYIVDNYLADYGVTRDAGMQAGGTLGAVAFDYVKISDVFDELLRMVASNGWLWRINEDKVLEAFLPGTGSWACPFSITTGGGLLVGDLSVREVREEYANRVIVVYGDGTNVPASVVASDSGEITAHGIYEAVFRTAGPIDAATAQDLADGYLAQTALVPTEVTFVTQEPGARAGQTITINVAARSINDDFLITNLRTWDQGGQLFYRVTAMSDGTSPVIKPKWKETYKLWADRAAVFGGGSAGPGTTAAYTRWYLSATTSALAFSDDYAGTWNQDFPDPVVPFVLTPLKDTVVVDEVADGNGGGVSISNAETSATNPFDVILYQAATEPLAAQTISGTINACLRAWELGTSDGMRLKVHVWVTQGDTSSVRGTLLSDYVDATNLPTASLQGVTFTSAQTLSSVTAQAGDRIIVEIGYRSLNSTTSSRTGQIAVGVGSAGADDLPPGRADQVSGSTTAGAAYVQFSNPVQLQ